MLDRHTLHTMVIDSLDAQIAVIDRDGVIVDVNAAWNAFGKENGISGTSAAVGSNYLKVLEAASVSGDRLAVEAAGGIREVVEGKRSAFSCEYPCHSPECRRWFMMRVTPLEGSGGTLFAISHHDITKRKLAEERAEHLAHHDALTGLANRRCFDRFLDEVLRRDLRNGTPVGLILIDVDRFKAYNDTLGHLAGDRCLEEIGRVLQRHARRPDDLAARLGGDEFAMILGDTGIAALERIASAICGEAEALGLHYGGAEERVTLSLGGVSAHPKRGQRAGTLLEAADRALYRAKSAGRNRVVVEQI